MRQAPLVEYIQQALRLSKRIQPLEYIQQDAPSQCVLSLRIEDCGWITFLIGQW